MFLATAFAILNVDLLQSIEEAEDLRLFSTFPAGLPGLGLLLLRLAVGSISVAQGASFLVASGAPASMLWLIGALTFVLGAFLMIGFLTPIASIVAALVSMGFALRAFPGLPSTHFAAPGAIETIVVTLALALLGAGAFSLDAFLFGRREIIIPDISRSPK
ncbi:hypothetical protein H7849_22315 [Alloacidobacterium dinghuense]|uniref:Uncharacterized protein n=2 Tax=Alloacidobacterium dinghuense TaxID=2763107 RepID=A0A7G8BRF4_9BACT|nr:hypothetical protein H7849_22315 [Alloacidobacterium dinghuense]